MSQRKTRRSGRAGGRVKMTEVAQVAGVSLASVSRALKNPGSVSPEILERVRITSERLGYSLNPIASSMSGAKTPIIGVIVPTLVNAFFSRTIQAIFSEIDPHGYQLMIGVHEYDQGREEKLIQTYLGWNPLALIVTGIHHNRNATSLLAKTSCPVVEMWDFDDRPIDSVIGCSMSEAGRMMARHLIEKGRRDLIFVGHILDRDPRARARSKAFIEEIRLHEGVTGTIMQVDERNAAAGDAIINEIVRQYPTADGIAFSGDAVALGALSGAQRLGIRVPYDIALMGFGDLDPSGFSQPPLTSIRPPHNEMGQEIGRHILERITDPDARSHIIDMGFRLIERATT